ncbi:hypothetical protein VTO73DRAFT_6286 [Trametes versicolor]
MFVIVDEEPRQLPPGTPVLSRNTAYSKPLVVLLCLDVINSLQEIDPYLLAALEERDEVHVARTRSQALRYLTSTALPQAVIACDGAMSYLEYHDVLLRLVQYAHGGGTVIYAGDFATSVRFPDLKAMFKVAWNLPWEMDTCDNQVFSLNFAARHLEIRPLVKKWAVSVIQIKNVLPECAVYLGQNQLKRLAKDKSGSLANVPLSAPAVFCKAGQGRLGYVGERNPTEPTAAIVLAMCFHPASRARVAPGIVSPVSLSTLDGTPRRSILIVSLEKGGNYDSYQPLYRSIRKNAWLTEIEDAETTMRLLSSNPPPSAVLFTDGAITRPEGTRVLTRLIEYVRAGGTAVFGAQFSNTISPLDLSPFFRKLGLGWYGGDYRRDTFALNPAGAPVPLLATALFPDANMKAVLVNVPRACAVYVPAVGEYGRSPVYAPNGASVEASLAAFGRVGRGSVGYVGDVNGEQASIRVIIEMLGVRIKPGDFGARTVMKTFSSHPVNGQSATYAREEEIPLPAADVRERKAQRAKTRKEKIVRANALRVEGNRFFNVGRWLEATAKYRAAVMVAGPETVYMVNLASAFLKLSLWELAESATCRALVHDPYDVQALYLRAMARKGLERFSAAEADLKRILELDSSDARALEGLASVEGGGSSRYYEWPGDDEVTGRGGSADNDGPLELEDESDSEDFEHVGNGKPCKSYNHDGCPRGQGCPQSHAPDARSVRDELGRNVCIYWLLGECRSPDERCFYAHDNSHLPDKGWWKNTRRLARLCKDFDNAVEAAPRAGVKEGILVEALKPVSWRKDMWTLTPADYAELAKLRAEEIW